MAKTYTVVPQPFFFHSRAIRLPGFIQLNRLPRAILSHVLEKRIVVILIPRLHGK